MKIAVYGATGNAGSHIVAEAVSRGHEVTALSRNPGAVPSGAEWQPGDLADAAGVARVAAAHDVVVTANGPSRVPGEDPGAFADLVAGVADAVGDTRLVVVGGAGSLRGPDGTRLFDSPDFPAEYQGEARATFAALERLQASDPSRDWTYLSPAPVFPVGEPTGRYVVGDDSPVGDTISAEDFALALLDEIERPAHRRVRFTVAAG